MARITGVSPTEPTPLLRVSEWFTRRKLGRSMEPLRGYARSNAVLLAMAGLEMGMERAKRIDPRLRGLAELRVAALVGCAFCLDIGSAIVRRLGVPDAQLLDLNRHRESTAFSAVEKAGLEVAGRIAAAAGRGRGEERGRVGQVLREREAVELTAAIAHENLRSRMNHALGYGADGFSTGGVCALPATGGTPH